MKKLVLGGSCAVSGILLTVLLGAGALARAGMGAFLTVKLRCSYEGLRFIPLSPALEAGTVLAWKKTQAFPPALSAFLEYLKECLSSISDDPK